MEVIFDKTERSPRVTFDGRALTIEGRSFMDNSVEFYRNLIGRLQSLDCPKLDVVINLNYFNTSSSKCLLELFRSLERMLEDGKDISIFWYYPKNTPDLEEAGEDYRDLLESIPFELVQVDE